MISSSGDRFKICLDIHAIGVKEQLCILEEEGMHCKISADQIEL